MNSKLPNLSPSSSEFTKIVNYFRKNGVSLKDISSKLGSSVSKRSRKEIREAIKLFLKGLDKNI
jgi:hypothetical protein